MCVDAHCKSLHIFNCALQNNNQKVLLVLKNLSRKCGKFFLFSGIDCQGCASIISLSQVLSETAQRTDQI